MSDPAVAAQAYQRAADSWRDGPERVYRRYAEQLVSAAPSPLTGARVADLAAGTGSVAHVLRAAGARPVALDAAPAMLGVARRTLPGLPVAAGDVLALPLLDGSVDAATIGFCINHLAEPHRLLEEAARVVRPGGAVLVSTFARGPDHPAKDVVNDLAARYGWRPSPWYSGLHEHASLTDTVGLLRACAVRAGLVDVEVTDPAVDTGVRSAKDLVRWRLGMPELATFLQSLGPVAAQRFRDESVVAVGVDPPALVRRILVLAARSPEPWRFPRQGP